MFYGGGRRTKQGPNKVGLTRRGWLKRASSSMDGKLEGSRRRLVPHRKSSEGNDITCSVAVDLRCHYSQDKGALDKQNSRTAGQTVGSMLIGHICIITALLHMRLLVSARVTLEQIWGGVNVLTSWVLLLWSGIYRIRDSNVIKGQQIISSIKDATWYPVTSRGPPRYGASKPSAGFWMFDTRPNICEAHKPVNVNDVCRCLTRIELQFWPLRQWNAEFIESSPARLFKAWY